jgi:DNA modification methylase
MKPVSLVERAIRNSSKTRDTVLDPFAGSGTTLMAAEAKGRTAALVELDPAYCDVIVQRWQDGTGGTAVRQDGAVFDALRREQGRDADGQADGNERAEAAA